MTPINEYSKETGLSEVVVINRIRNGELAGKLKDGQWYVDAENAVSHAPDSAAATLNNELISSVIFGIGMALAAGINFYKMKEYSQPIGMLDLLVIFLVFGGLGAFFRNKGREEKQKKKEDLPALKEILEKPYSLYLRPFEVTNILKVSAKSTMNFVDQEQDVDFEHILSESLEFENLPLVALGKPGEAIGAARILVPDEDWKKEISNLIENAKIIVISPSLNEGTLWEIDYILGNKLLNKTIFIMRPKLKGETKSGTLEYWKSIQTAFAARGVWLPEYQENGGLFRINENRTEKESMYSFPKSIKQGGRFDIPKKVLFPAAEDSAV